MISVEGAAGGHGPYSVPIYECCRPQAAEVDEVRNGRRDTDNAGVQLAEAQVTPEDTGAKIIELIVFSLQEQELSADIDQIREIIRTGPITPIPDSPEFIKGVANVRGEIIVVIDLKARLLLPGASGGQSKHIVVTAEGKNLFGLMVDEVTEVLRLPETQIKHAPDIVASLDRRYIGGVLTIDDRLIILLDLTKVLSEEELARLTEVFRKAREEGRSMEESTEDLSSEAQGEGGEDAEAVTTAAEALPEQTGSGSAKKKRKPRKKKSR